MEWLKDPLNSSSPLTCEEGLKTIDAFYTESQHLLETGGSLQNPGTGDDEDFSTLMEDIDQLTAPNSEQAQPEDDNQTGLTQGTTSLHLTATAAEQTAEATLEEPLVQDSPSLAQPTAPIQHPETQVAPSHEPIQSDASQDQVASTNEQAHTKVAPHNNLVPNAASPDQQPSDTGLDNSLVQDNASRDQSAAPESQSESPPTLQTGIAEGEASHEQGVNSTEQLTTELPSEDNLTQDTAQIEQQSPEPESNMTPHSKGEEQLPSSEGKSSMMDEMRSEERRYPLVSQEAAAAPGETEQIQLPGIATAEADDMPQLDGRSHRANLHTELNAAGVHDDVAPSHGVVDSAVGIGTRTANVGETTKKRITRSTKQQASDEQDMFPDLSIEVAKEEAVEPMLGSKRKRDSEDVPEGIEQSAPAANKHKLEIGHIVKKRMTRSTKPQASEEQSVISDLSAEAAANNELVGTAPSNKRKRKIENPPADSNEADIPAKKTKRPARRSTRNLAITDTTADSSAIAESPAITESPVNRRSSRNIVGKRELGALAEQKPQRSNSNRRETRAEVAKGPNAGLAVKERRRAMERKDSEK